MHGLVPREKLPCFSLPMPILRRAGCLAQTRGEGEGSTIPTRYLQTQVRTFDMACAGPMPPLQSPQLWGIIPWLPAGIQMPAIASVMPLPPTQGRYLATDGSLLRYPTYKSLGLPLPFPSRKRAAPSLSSLVLSCPVLSLPCLAVCVCVCACVGVGVGVCRTFHMGAPLNTRPFLAPAQAPPSGPALAVSPSRSLWVTSTGADETASKLQLPSSHLPAAPLYSSYHHLPWPALQSDFPPWISRRPGTNTLVIQNPVFTGFWRDSVSRPG
ncbi:hypothetical protein GQ53DRAFT_380345 [Thozetella sp. PMI_491]|nr:hypothetical protein GQ53DRAFT_380345 [Thozetella sp. PMI_491]